MTNVGSAQASGRRKSNTLKRGSFQFTSLDRLTLERYHAKLKMLLPELAIPGPLEEVKNGAEAYKVI